MPDITSSTSHAYTQTLPLHLQRYSHIQIVDDAASNKTLVRIAHNYTAFFKRVVKKNRQPTIKKRPPQLFIGNFPNCDSAHTTGKLDAVTHYIHCAYNHDTYYGRCPTTHATIHLSSTILYPHTSLHTTPHTNPAFMHPLQKKPHASHMQNTLHIPLL